MFPSHILTVFLSEANKSFRALQHFSLRKSSTEAEIVLEPTTSFHRNQSLAVFALYLASKRA